LTKILHIVDLSKTGGVEIMFLHFIKKAIKWRNYKHYVFALRISNKRRIQLQSLGVKTFSHSDNLYNLKHRIKIPYILKKYNIDIIYGQNFSGNLWGGIGKLLYLNNVKLISHEHGGSWGAYGILKLLSYFWIFQSNKIITNSKASLLMIDKAIKKNRKTKVIYNGVKIENNKNYEPNSFNILFVGRITDIKGVDSIFEAAKIILKKFNDVNFIFVGDGNKRYDLEKKSQELKLTNRIKFTGIVSDVSKYMNEAKILLLPSVREPLGNVLIEAGLLRLPAIASKIDGIPEIINDGHSGVLIEPTLNFNSYKKLKYVIDSDGELKKPLSVDPVILALEIEKLIIDKALRKKLARNAYKRSAFFTLDRYVENLKNFFDLETI
jgi:glycosyltransferase involved in cell wall biosynthesis